MNIKQVAKLLNENNIPVKLTETTLEEERGLSENYYALKHTNGTWEFLFVKCERHNPGVEEIVKEFDNEADASKYFYLFELNQYFWNNYVYIFELENEDLNIDEPYFTLENLIRALSRLNIDSNYYSLTGEIKEHSIYLDVINEKESRVKFFGENCKEIFVSMVLENHETYRTLYQYVYYLYLLDKKSEELLENEEINRKFTDEDFHLFLS